MSSFTAKYKVSIIWLPEKLEEKAANKLLKLIEEPYDDCKFILVSDNAKGILPTIFSRVQRVELRRLGVQQVADYLATVVKPALEAHAADRKSSEEEVRV